MKSRARSLPIWGIFLGILFVIPACSVVYNIPDITDHRIFPSRSIYHDPEHVFYFHDAETAIDIGRTFLTNAHYLSPDAISLNDFVDQSKTVAFLIIRNDTLLYERYDKGFSASEIANLFSVTKAFITTLVGIAIEEGYLEGPDEHITDFFPELGGKAYFDDLKIRHLLRHTSGVKFKGGKYNPFSDNARYYYGRNLRKLVMNAEFYCRPGKEIHYSSFNCQLLALILEKATGCSLSSYLEEKIWKKIGMQYDATWSTDRKGDGCIEKAFSCLNCIAIDLAKLGRLYLHGGIWEGEVVLPASYTAEAVKRDTTCGSSWCYQYNFRRGPYKYQSYFSRGLYGQLLYVYPEKDVIIVRLGKSDLGYQPDFINRNVLEILDQL